MEKKWFYSVQLKPRGPFTEEYIRGLINRGQIGPEDLLFEEGENQWRPAIQWRCFEPLLYPAHQNVPIQEATGLDKKDWVLIRHEQGRSYQDGPFAVADIKELLRGKQVTPESLVWKSGLSGWVQLKERIEFQIEN